MEYIALRYQGLKEGKDVNIHTERLQMVRVMSRNIYLPVNDSAPPKMYLALQVAH